MEKGALTRGPERKKKIAVVEDEIDIAQLIAKTLRSYHFDVEYFTRGGDFLRHLATASPDVTIIDLGLPDMDGLTLVKKSQDRGLATIVLTGRGNVADRVVGLELGADDYLVKPFEPRELVARINSLVRRIEKSLTPSQSIASFGEWRFDINALSLTSPSGESVPLSRAESQLLELFLRAPNRVLKRDFLMEARGISTIAFDRSIDVRVSRLRQKLHDDPQNPTLIRTVYGSGYLFAATVSWNNS